MEILEDWKGPSPEQEIKGLKKLWDKSNLLKRKKEEFPLTKDLNLRRETLESNLKTYVEKLYSVTQSICLPCEMNFESPVNFLARNFEIAAQPLFIQDVLDGRVELCLCKQNVTMSIGFDVTRVRGEIEGR